MSEAIQLTQPNHEVLRIRAEDGRDLLTVESDGTVTGSVEDASEAGRIFVRELRGRTPDDATVERVAQAIYGAEGQPDGDWETIMFDRDRQVYRNRATEVLAALEGEP